MPICFISDLHLGRDPAKTWAEPVSSLEASEIITRLKHVIVSHNVDLLVIGGDLIDHGDIARIDHVVDLLKLIYVPTLLCFGNHDLTMPDALNHWKRALARWPQATLADAKVSTPQFEVVAINTHWVIDGSVRESWTPGNPPIPALLDGQRAWLRETLADCRQPTLLVCHAPPNLTLPGELADSHLSIRTHAYRDAIEAEFARSGKPEQVIGVLAGHIHLSSVVHGARTLITNAAISEQPSLARIIDYIDGKLRITNVALESAE